MPRLGLFALVAVAMSVGDAHGHAVGRPMGFTTKSGAAMVLRASSIKAVVRGPIVEVEVVQQFLHTGDRATEATYIFPLPADAAVSAMTMRYARREIHAAIEPREAAQRRYDAAIIAGVSAALLEQERGDVFTQTVAAIPPGESVEVTLRYDTVARYHAGWWELVLPMVVAPRYVPGSATGRATTGSGHAPDTDRAPDASRVTPPVSPGAGGPTAIAIHFVDEPREVASPSHALQLGPGGARSDVALDDPRSDHDAIVRWRAPAASAAWLERDGEGGFAAVVLEAPPAAPRKAPVRMVLALDRAATLRGDGDVIQRPLVRALLGGMGTGDRVRVIGGATSAWAAPADALAAIERSWGTSPTAFDLTRVLERARAAGAAIVLVSDGLVADDRAVIAAAARLGAAVHVIGIGPAPARATLHHIAAVTGGTLRYATAGDDLGSLATDALADLASPPARTAVNWGSLGALDVEPAVQPRLGAGQAMIMLARVPRVPGSSAVKPRVAPLVRARGELFAFEPLAPPRVVDGAVTPRGPLARRWARERLGSLLAGAHDRNAVTQLALGYGLVSPYTSLVAIGNDVIVEGGVTRSVAVPVSLPAGMQWHAVKQAMDAALDGPSPSATTGRDHKPDADQAVRTALPGETIVIEGRAPTIDQGSTKTAITVGDDFERTLQSIGDTQGELLIMGVPRRFLFTAALGGGLAFDGGASSLAALHVRAETARRIQIGGEAALWLVDGDTLAARLLITNGYRISRWFAAGVGLGLHTGDGTGLATSVQLRIYTHLPRVTGYLRYDAAIRFNRATRELIHAPMLGLELAF